MAGVWQLLVAKPGQWRLQVGNARGRAKLRVPACGGLGRSRAESPPWLGGPGLGALWSGCSSQRCSRTASSTQAPRVELPELLDRGVQRAQLENPAPRPFPSDGVGPRRLALPPQPRGAGPGENLGSCAGWPAGPEGGAPGPLARTLQAGAHSRGSEEGGQRGMCVSRFLFCGRAVIKQKEKENP